MQKQAQRRRGFRISVILLSLIAALVLARALLPWTIKTLLHRQMPALIGVDLRVQDIDLALLQGRLTLHGLQLAQPAGFSDSNLLEARLVTAEISYRDLLRRNVRLTLRSEGLRVILEHDRTGALNLSRLMASDDQAAMDTAADGRTNFGFILQQAVLREANLQYDLPDGPSLSLTNINLVAAGLNFPAAPAAARQKGAIRIRAQLAQPGAPSAALRAVIRVELPAVSAIPDLDGSITLQGLHPQMLACLLPPEAAHTLAPGPLDGTLSFRHTDDHWAGNLQVTTDNGQRTLVEVEALDLNLTAGELEVQSLRLAQPAGFGRDPLLNLPQLRLLWDTAAGRGLHIRALEASGPVINFGRDQAGRFLWDLFTADNRPATAATNKPAGLYLLEKAAISSMSLSYQDAALSDELFEVRLEQLQIRAENLFMTEDAGQAPWRQGRIDVSAEIPQPGQLPGKLEGALDMDYATALPGVEMVLSLENFDPRQHDRLIPQRIQKVLPEGSLTLQCRARTEAPALVGSLQLYPATAEPLLAIDVMSYNWEQHVFTLEGLRLAQPIGFPPGVMLSVGRLRAGLKVNGRSTTVTQSIFAEIDQPRAIIIKSKGGIYNYEFMLPDEGPKPETEIKTPAPDGVQPWRLASLQLRDGTLFYEHHTPSARPLKIRMTNITCAVSNIHFDATDPTSPGTFELTAEIPQQWRTAGFLGFFRRPRPSTGRLGLAGVIGRLDAPVPDINLAGCVIGLELASLAPLVPPGTTQAIGGEALDIQARLAMATNFLSARFTARTIANHALPLVSLDGTPAKPQIQISSLVLGIAGRLGGALGNTAQDLTMAAHGLAGTALQTTKQAGKDAWQTVETTGRGLVYTLRGAAQADVPAITRGLREATLDSARGAIISVIDLGDGIIQGTTATKRTGVGTRRREIWRNEIPERWETRWRQTRENACAMPYPPTP
ncbi:MAG: hypothetical protein ABR497_10380 [Kiritimatiellia bacterium]|nr:DUF748 domain-containing protein [Lentisphaerota bacterium]